MARHKLFDTPAVLRLQNVIESVKDGELQFPDFQRDFVWDDEQRKRLLDSILKGLPIGSILVWRTLNIDLAVKTNLLPGVTTLDRNSKSRNLVLDGLQRLTTLFRALTDSAEHDDRNASAEDAPARWPIYFDLEASLDEGDEDRFHFRPARGDVPGTWLPMSKLFAPSALYVEQKRLAESGHPELANKAERLANAFKDYELPLIPLFTESLEQAAQSFERVNSQGSRMGEADMLRALTYKQDAFDLTERLKGITQSLAWEELDAKTYVNALKVVMGMNVYHAEMRKIANEVRSKPEILNYLERGFGAAVSFLFDTCGVRSQQALPYAYQLISLAAAHFVLCVHKGEPEFDFKVVGERLRIWFWATTYSEHFSQMTGTQLKGAFEHVERLCAGGPDPIPEGGAQVEVVELRYLSGASVRALARAHLLASQHLVDEGGKPVDGPGIVQWGTRSLHRLFLDRRATLPENRFLAAPGQAKRLRSLLTESTLPGVYPPEFYQGHVFPAPGVVVGGTDEILKWRREKLQELERAFVEGIRLKYRIDERQ